MRPQMHSSRYSFWRGIAGAWACLLLFETRPLFAGRSNDPQPRCELVCTARSNDATGEARIACRLRNLDGEPLLVVRRRGGVGRWDLPASAVRSNVLSFALRKDEVFESLSGLLGIGDINPGCYTQAELDDALIAPARGELELSVRADESTWEYLVHEGATFGRLKLDVASVSSLANSRELLPGSQPSKRRPADTTLVVSIVPTGSGRRECSPVELQVSGTFFACVSNVFSLPVPGQKRSTSSTSTPKPERRRCEDQ